MNLQKSTEIFEESKKYIPGGVNSPVRALTNMGITPPVIKTGNGGTITDEDGNTYVDFIGAWGPMLLGHNDPDIINAIQDTVSKSIAFGAPTDLELKLAKHLCTTLDNIDLIRMVNSGTEATMSAVRLARGYTKKNKIIKFAGCYHGHFDDFLVSAGSGVMTEGIPGSAGVPTDSIKNTLIATYNSIESITEIFTKYGDDIAGVILEPVAGNMGVIKASPEFMKELERLCRKHGSLLIFDEVMCGFRVAYKGAQTLFDVTPDIVTYAKIMGGGLPCGAYGGRKEIMEKLSPVGPVYQAGTMSGNPVVMAAGLAAVTKLYNHPEYYTHLEKLGKKLETGMLKIAKEKNIPLTINRCGAMMTVFFTDLDEVRNYEDAKTCNTELFNKYYLHLLENGIYVAPSQFEAMFLSVKHTEEDIDKYLHAFETFEI